MTFNIHEENTRKHRMNANFFFCSVSVKAVMLPSQKQINDYISELAYLFMDVLNNTVKNARAILEYCSLNDCAQYTPTALLMISLVDFSFQSAVSSKLRFKLNSHQTKWNKSEKCEIFRMWMSNFTDFQCGKRRSYEARRYLHDELGRINHGFNGLSPNKRNATVFSTKFIPFNFH